MLAKLESLGLVLPEQIAIYYRDYNLLVNLALVVVLGLLAFFGYRIFKAVLIIGGGVIGGTLAGLHLTPIIAPYVAAYIPGWLSLNAAVGIVVGLVAALLCWKAVKLVVFAGGAAAGYLFVGPLAVGWLATLVPSVAEIASSSIGTIIVSVVTALVCALILYIFFKLIFIVATSIGCPAAIGFVLLYAVIPQPADDQIVLALAIGAALGLIALYYQFKTNAKVRSFRF
jgi:hypothetical protein